MFFFAFVYIKSIPKLPCYYQLNTAAEDYFLLNLEGLTQNEENSWMFNWGLWGFQQNGFSQYILTQRFDALLFLRESGPPTFDKK
ncbi:MAG: hypothetical protein R8P61_14830 [Bacteroidia bacterium]|nr:hypothetical protein [Bacteroidia bacterium]